MKTIAITHPHPLFIEGIKKILEGSSGLSTTIKFTSTGLEQLKYFLTQENLDLVIFRIDRDQKPGLTFCRNVKKRYPQTKMLVFAESENYNTVKKHFNAGINAYLLETCKKQEFILALRQIFSGAYYLSTELPVLWRGYISIKGRKSNNLGRPTHREREVLDLIVEEYTTQEIAEKLFISISTVETHRLNLLRKLGVKNSAGLVREAILGQLYRTYLTQIPGKP